MNYRWLWIVALAAIALWGVASVASARDLAFPSLSIDPVEDDAAGSGDEAASGASEMNVLVSAASNANQTDSKEPCEPTATPAPEADQRADESPEPAPPSTQGQPETPSTPLQATFHLCGTPDPQTERAIEQLIAGRNFRATLVSRPDGCADLTIAVSPGAAGSGRQSTNLTVSTGGGRTIAVQIVTENGVTNVTLGPGR